MLYSDTLWYQIDGGIWEYRIKSDVSTTNVIERKLITDAAFTTYNTYPYGDGETITEFFISPPYSPYDIIRINNLSNINNKSDGSVYYTRPNKI